MAGELLLVSQFAAAALMLALAGWLLWLRFESPLNRAFALFLVLRATVIVTNRIPDLAPSTADHLLRTSPYFLIAAPLALAYFCVLYSRSLRRHARLALVLLLATGAAVELAYALDHCLVTCATADGRALQGPLSLFQGALPLVSAAAALLFAVETARAPGAARATRLLSLAFLLNAVADAALVAGFAFTAGFAPASSFAESPWASVVVLEALLALPVALVAIAVLVRATRREDRRFAGRSVLLASLAAATGLAAGGVPAIVGFGSLFLLGIWRLALPLLASYALLRHSLFDLDVRLRDGVKRGTVGAVFVAVFFVVSEGAASLLSQEWGAVLGLLASGFLVFALAPLQHFADRLATAAFPTQGAGAPPAAAAGTYREQARVAWADGAVDRSERRMLDRLRQQLGLTHEEAALIEAEVARDDPHA